MEKIVQDSVILAIETSCDETSAAVVRGGREILSNVVSSQVDVHKIYGGVVPEIASRKHVEFIIPVIDQALSRTSLNMEQVDAVAVTYGPGLVGALLVGLSAAKAICIAKNIPLVGVNHIHGHIAANYIEYPELEPNFVCLVASGGHSHIVAVTGYNEFKVMGRTRDDAAGEVFDKIARVLGLGYPGGPIVDKLAQLGDENAVSFPRVYFGNGSLDFSFSGVKTAVVNHVARLRQNRKSVNVENICASFQKAVVDVLVKNTLSAAHAMGTNKVALAGGVASNSYLRQRFTIEAKEKNLLLYVPRPAYCTDNAAMIGCAGYFKYLAGDVSSMTLNAVSDLDVDLKKQDVKFANDHK